MSAKSSQTTDSSQSGTSTTNPWDVQAPYLSQAFSGANTALGQAGNAAIPTNFTAQYSPEQVNAFNQMLGYGTGNQAIPNSSAAAGAQTSAAGANGISAGLGGLASFMPQGGAANNIANGLAYAGNVPVSALTQAAMQSANDEAKYITQPGINANAAADGSINSSRTAIQQGLLQKGLAQSAANTAAGIESNAYNTGAGLSEQNSEAQNSNILSKLLGLTQGGASAVNSGTVANSGAVNNAGGLFNIANMGITGGYNAAQAPLTNQSQQFTANTNDPFAALNNFYNIIGSHNWGSNQASQSSGTSTTNYNPSTLSQVGAWTNLVGSLF
jgi:hypothetical protein